MTTLLIDGDIIAYRSAAATEVTVAWDDDLWTVHGYTSETNAMQTRRLQGSWKKQIALGVS